MEQVYALFRQMVFNVAICNRDDHAKNFSFQLIGDDWQLSPAYDMLPSMGFNGYHTTTINNQGEPSWDDVMAVAAAVELNKKRAASICDEIIDKCKQRNMYMKK
jgi:serine/threonine-protein kinase HipA